MEAGTLVAGRYRLRALMQQQQILYEAEDMQACWQCVGGNCPRMRSVPVRRCTATPIPGAPGWPARNNSLPALGVQLGGLLRGGQRFSWCEPPALPAPAGSWGGLAPGWDTARHGRVHELTKTACWLSLWRPAEAYDGPGLLPWPMGWAATRVVSGQQAALRVLAEHVIKDIVLPELAGDPSPDEELLLRLQSTWRRPTMPSTWRARSGQRHGHHAHGPGARHAALWPTGDCRAYRWNAEGLSSSPPTTRWYASMIANGQAAPEEIHSHPHRHHLPQHRRQAERR